ncbi:hypothetical protein [Clostridium botulinum]|uniref:hypothetical protein n=1 Tax=Clostridium botulinum TaxID=1491 RepID=UPI0002DBE6BF|nr:hypothetical protein [Clostridium botulinum]KLU74306.1 hypothetical protein CBC3_p0309 [Clostridium botulinum V891]MCD3202836.1 hypothetical protein [Clostridium botulinum C/D]MCD3230876.1 hypothetical protein [Clostridium botulinum C/D]MCD3253938.1 hypothetical protein [Clostridium botulinum C/D]MCD3279466.1 hypothetical protein [Clostridium botulinum C/D]
MARPNTLTVSFSKKNLDVKNLIDNKKEQMEGFEHSQYVCDAIRFYEKYKDKEFNNINKDEIRKIVDERFQELKNELLNNKESLVALDDEKEKFNDAILEQNIENINPAFLDED